MASEQYFASAPPFPSDVAVAEIPTIPLSSLWSSDASKASAASLALFDACRDMGFFQLDLRGDAVGEAMTAEIDEILRVVTNTMALSTEEKMRYARKPPQDLLGYKREGDTKTETGQPDRCEFYNLGQDELLGTEPARAAPATVEQGRDVMRSYVSHGQQVLGAILDALSTQLDLPPTIFRDLQPANQASGTMLRLIRYQPSLTPGDVRTGLSGHTDFGTVTLLVNVLGGLQVLRAGADDPTDEGAWAWVRPQPRCLIVNMGDAMVEWTAGVLRSNMHRVNYSPGEQRFAERLSVALLVRPRKTAAMKRLVGGRIPTREDDRVEGVLAEEGIGAGELTAREWEVKRLFALREGRNIAQSRGGRAPRGAPVAVAV